MLPHAAPFPDGLLLCGKQAFLQAAVQIAVRVEKSRAAGNHQIVEGAPVRQENLGEKTPVIVPVRGACGQKTHPLPEDGCGKQFAGFTGIVSGFWGARAQFGSVNARQPHHAPVCEPEGIPVKTVPHRSRRHVLCLGRVRLAGRPRNEQQNKGSQQQRPNVPFRQKKGWHDHGRSLCAPLSCHSTSAATGCARGGASCAAPWLRSGGCAHG